NGANGSFVYQIADADIPAEKVAEDPVGKLLELGDALPNPAIPAPADIFGKRRNSKGLDLTDPLAFGAMEAARERFRTHQWQAGAEAGGVAVFNPADPNDLVGRVSEATPAQVDAAVAAAEASDWGR